MFIFSGTTAGQTPVRFYRMAEWFFRIDYLSPVDPKLGCVTYMCHGKVFKVLIHEDTSVSTVPDGIHFQRVADWLAMVQGKYVPKRQG